MNIWCHLLWEKLPDFNAIPVNLHWHQDSFEFFQACLILIGQFKFQARLPYARWTMQDKTLWGISCTTSTAVSESTFQGICLSAWTMKQRFKKGLLRKTSSFVVTKIIFTGGLWIYLVTYQHCAVHLHFLQLVLRSYPAVQSQTFGASQDPPFWQYGSHVATNEKKTKKTTLKKYERWSGETCCVYLS